MPVSFPPRVPEALEDEKCTGCDAETRVVMEPAPASAFEVVESHLLLEHLMVTFDAPSLSGHFDKARQWTRRRERRERE